MTEELAEAKECYFFSRINWCECIAKLEGNLDLVDIIKIKRPSLKTGDIYVHIMDLGNLCENFAPYCC